MDWFRFGDGFLGLQSDDSEFRRRFGDLYHECRVEEPVRNEVVVRCAVAQAPGGRGVRVAFDDPEALDQVPLAVATTAEFGYREFPGESSQRVVRSPSHLGELVFDESGFTADPDSPWQSVVAMLALHRVLRLQRTVLFFHAAAVAVGDLGLLLMGPKEAGKTTLSLALADRGHPFFADEISAVRKESREIVPFRRRLSIRPGPASSGVTRGLSRGAHPVVRLGDGTLRTRAQPADFSPGPCGTARACAIFFLQGKGSAAHVERFSPTWADLGRLSPYESMTWGQPPGIVAFQLLQFLGGLRCYSLNLGSIDETATLIERTMQEDRCG